MAFEYSQIRAVCTEHNDIPRRVKMKTQLVAVALAFSFLAAPTAIAGDGASVTMKGVKKRIKACKSLVNSASDKAGEIGTLRKAMVKKCAAVRGCRKSCGDITTDQVKFCKRGCNTLKADFPDLHKKCKKWCKPAHCERMCRVMMLTPQCREARINFSQAALKIGKLAEKAQACLPPVPGLACLAALGGVASAASGAVKTDAEKIVKDGEKPCRALKGCKSKCNKTFKKTKKDNWAGTTKTTAKTARKKCKTDCRESHSGKLCKKKRGEAIRIIWNVAKKIPAMIFACVPGVGDTMAKLPIPKVFKKK
jgi:hypothetical protein